MTTTAEITYRRAITIMDAGARHYGYSKVIRAARVVMRAVEAEPWEVKRATKIIDNHNVAAGIIPAPLPRHL